MRDYSLTCVRVKECSMDRSFIVQLNNYRLTTAEILYWMPDHRHVLQSFVWQNLDIGPEVSRPHQVPRLLGAPISTARCTACGSPTPS